MTLAWGHKDVPEDAWQGDLGGETKQMLNTSFLPGMPFLPRGLDPIAKTTRKTHEDVNEVVECVTTKGEVVIVEKKVHKPTPFQKRKAEHSKQWEKVYNDIDEKDDLTFEEMSDLVNFLKRGDRIYKR